MSHIRKFLLTAAVTLTALTVTTPVFADGNMENAISWMSSIADDNDHGYSQENRWGSDYDCSSLVITACWKAGFKLGYVSRTTGYTGDMISAFKSAGFRWIPASDLGLSGNSTSGLKRGDILLTPGAHTEVYLGGGYMIGAKGCDPTSAFPNRSSKSGDQGGEICVTSYRNYPWSGVLRYGGGTTATSSSSSSSSSSGKRYSTGTYRFSGSDSLNVRRYPGTGNSIVGRLYPGDSCKVTSVSGDWGYISTSSFDGWIHLGYCKYIGISTSTASSSGSASYVSSSGTKYVKSGIGSLNLRSGAGTGYRVLTSIPAGAKISVLGSSGGWVKTSYGGQTGYVSADYLTGSSSSGSSSYSSGSSGSGSRRVNTETLNMRSGAGTSYRIVVQLNSGEKVSILDSSDGWYKVSCRGYTGWVLGDYIS